MRPRHSAEVVPGRGGERRLLGRRDSVEVIGLQVYEPEHFTRLSPSYGGDSERLFRLAMLPVRLAALAVLWATSSPGRVLAAAGMLVAALMAL